mmetsp:Transcript_34619/g.99742  ORF Transcript_34619/g.99742 Transcript_34619/m.99742 type:complete len:448 (+) Transcript_34619:92-1435(+)
MVVCFIVKVRNSSSSTFYVVQAGDPFYSPKIGGKSCGNQRFEIPPGFEAPCEGLIVPWAATSRCGLEIGIVGEDGQKVHCVVGPSDIDDGQVDWLRVHTSTWKVVGQEHWLPLGKRHLLGAIGGSVELHLTFRDRVNVGLAPGEEATGEPPAQDGTAIDLASRVAERMHFEREASSCSPDTVFLNVYDLASAASIPNSLLCNSLMKTFGAFHAAIEVYGEEWGFYRQQEPEMCGICRSRFPRRHPIHVYRQSVNLGSTPLQDWQVWKVIREKVIPFWPSSRYDLIRCNCIHFAEEFSQLLQVNSVPTWVKGLHEAGAALTRVPWPFNMLTAGAEAPPAEESPTPAAASSSGSARSAPPALPPRRASTSSAGSGASAPAMTDMEGAAGLGMRRPGFLPEPLPTKTPPSRPGCRFEQTSPESARSQDDDFVSIAEPDGGYCTPVTHDGG